MKTGEICKKYHISRDTLRFYIKKNLLTPLKDGKDYNWTVQDEYDLENILALREMSISITVISKIKDNHDKYCGTLRQAEENFKLLKHTLEDRKEKINRLNQEIDGLNLLLEQLKGAIAERK